MTATADAAGCAAAQFQFHGDIDGVAPYGNGHINDTYAVTCNQAGTPVRYILQRINHAIFKQPAALMENVARVTAHVQRRLAADGVADASRRALTLVPTRGSALFHVDDAGNHWRAYLFIEHAQTYDIIESPRQAFAAAAAFGAFQRVLADLPAPRLHETIPNFHHTRLRFEALAAALAADPLNRAAGVRAELDFALAREGLASVLLDALARGDVAECVTHNDTKLNNVMIDAETQEGLCVIDLDTVMPGLALYDFGDMVRTATMTAAEDERDLSKVGLALPMFEALVQGYLASAGSWLGRRDLELLPLSGRLLTFECGIRFLTDHLLGDVYFRIHRPNHNLDRCRTQFRLVEKLEAAEAEMAGLVKRALVRGCAPPGKRLRR